MRGFKLQLDGIEITGCRGYALAELETLDGELVPVVRVTLRPVENRCINCYCDVACTITNETFSYGRKHGEYAI